MVSRFKDTVKTNGQTDGCYRSFCIPD